MKVPCAALWPEPGKEALHWGYLAGKLGSPAPLLRPFLLGIRGAKPGDSVTHQPVHRAAYDDAFVLLTPTAPPLLFPGATHAYQRDSRLSPDVDGDGRGDVGSIRCGRYVLTLAISSPHPIFTVSTHAGGTRLPAHRDFDHDGVVSEEEALRSELIRSGPQVSDLGCYATAVLMHTGFDAPPGAAHRSSIACLTASLSWLERIAAAGRVVDLLLVNAWDLVPAAEEAVQIYLSVPPRAKGVS